MDKEVSITDRKGNYLEARLSGEIEKEIVSLKLFGEELGSREVEGGDFFYCLIKLREWLETKELFLLCLGSNTNVHPSRMSTQMSRGLKAYRLTLGKQAELTDLVEIFDPALEDDVGSIQEQRDFFEVWLKSLRK